MAAPLREIGSATSKAVGSFRETVQDLLVPELRAMKGSIDSLRTELQLRDERQTRTTEELGKRLTGAVEALAQEVRLRDSHQTDNLQALSQKLDLAMTYVSASRR